MSYAYVWNPETKEIRIIEGRLSVGLATLLGVVGQVVDTNYSPSEIRMRYGQFIEGERTVIWVGDSPESLDPEFRTQLLLLGVS